MNKIIVLFTSLLLMGWSLDAAAFSCQVPDTGQTMDSGSANIYVNLAPSIGVGQNLVVDLSSSIFCRNDDGSESNQLIDYINLTNGTAFGGALAAFTGSIYWNTNSYPLPLNSSSSKYIVTDNNYLGLPLRMYLTATGTAGGAVINAGELIARLNMHKVASNGNPKDFTWNIYANNNVVIPTGGCDVSTRDVTVTLPDYPGTMAVPVTIHCAQNQNIAYYLTGTTADRSNSIFRNTASASPAQGIGVQITRNGTVVPANRNVSLGKVGTSPVNLGLTATYARTSDPITAGNVQSIIGVTFVYE
ncbi:fimbrial protein [Klebsiella michiganensis]|uniref:fimbrial protein n=1 Tax=Klebsiella michiganensis TaxID=1134687 RepID=UPI001664A7BB|nr:fimbrial protein [Klebsiella michiganensis]MBD0987420.1 fimbrial protein [Klebsiella michiganensis]MDM4525624.1 fimbrial protein [Klebsiella michiganensis]MDM4536583.1 fimbrial protein [Klebsiella michiganensis]MDS7798171.1 fimbrial protein [Klebsiella michiganensis]HBK4602055.1 fimbrial protein [Klebsiella michiganensis]